MGDSRHIKLFFFLSKPNENIFGLFPHFCSLTLEGQTQIPPPLSHLTRCFSSYLSPMNWSKLACLWLLMEPTCVSVFVRHAVPCRSRRRRPLSLFTQASQQRAFAFSGGNHRQSLRSRRDADPPLWLPLPALLLQSPPELPQLLSTHLSLLDSGFCGWHRLPGWKETRWGRSSVVHPSLGNSSAGKSIDYPDINSFWGHTCFWLTLVRTIRPQWRCFMRRPGTADSHEKSHFPCFFKPWHFANWT